MRQPTPSKPLTDEAIYLVLQGQVIRAPEGHTLRVTVEAVPKRDDERKTT
jgi:hypothetical protein